MPSDADKERACAWLLPHYAIAMDDGTVERLAAEFAAVRREAIKAAAEKVDSLDSFCGGSLCTGCCGSMHERSVQTIEAMIEEGT